LLLGAGLRVPAWLPVSDWLPVIARLTVSPWLAGIARLTGCPGLVAHRGLIAEIARLTLVRWLIRKTHHAPLTT